MERSEQGNVVTAAAQLPVTKDDSTPRGPGDNDDRRQSDSKSTNSKADVASPPPELSTATLADHKESASTEGEDTPDKPKSCQRKLLGILIRTRGILLVLAAGLQLSLSNYFAKSLIQWSHYTPLQVNMSRFAGLLIFAGIQVCVLEAMKRHPLTQICELSTKQCLRACGLLFLRGVFGGTSMIMQYYAIEHISIGDTAAIIFSNPLLVLIGARILMHEPCGVFQTCAGLLAILGVFVVAKPPFIFGKDNSDNSGEGRTLGISMALSAMVLSVCVNISLRLVKNFHYSTVNAVFGFVSLLISFGVAGALHGFDRKEEITSLDCTLLSIVGLLCWSGMCCFTLAYHYENAGAVSIVRSMEIVFSHLWPMIDHVYPEATSIGGACLVIISVVLVGFNTYVASLSTEHPLRRRFGFVLK